MYNLHYVPTTLMGTKLKRNYIWGYANKKVEYHCFRLCYSVLVSEELKLNETDKSTKSFENVANFKYSGTKVTSQNNIKDYFRAY
jgi:hypothetical protein